MRIRGTTAVALAALLSACGGGGDGGAGSNGTNVTGGSSNNCDSTDPGGLSCVDARQCGVKCSCESGTVTAGICDGRCGIATDMCTLACEHAKVGPYKNRHCFIGETTRDAGDDAGGSTGGDGGATGPAGSTGDGGGKGGDGDSGATCVPFRAPCKSSDDCCSQACDAVFKICD
jgi:hypothetical protein